MIARAREVEPDVERFDVFVIGGGGTGSEVAFTLGRHGGLKVGIAERDKLGGECNHYGCVPTKVMLKSAKVAAWARSADRFGIRVPEVTVDFKAVMDRVRTIMEGNTREGPTPFERMGITVVLDDVRLVGPHQLEVADGTRIEADKVVLATGTEPTAPPVAGLGDGPFWTNKEAIWSPTDVPSSLAILGAGPIGIEFGQIYARFGSRVTIIELLDRILPLEDPDASAALAPALEAEGIRLLVGRRTRRAEYGPSGWRLELEGGDVVEAEELLVATGRRPSFAGHDLEAAGVELTPDGKPVLGDTLRTTADHIWAAGDATGELLFTHVGDYEAKVVVADILGRPRRRDYRVVPRATFCEPEVASVGLTEDQAREAGHEVKAALVRFEDNERAHIEGATHGIVKLVADARTGELVGGHIVGEGAGDMIHEVVAAMAGRLPASVVGDAIHAYPTLSESIRGAFIQLASS